MTVKKQNETRDANRDPITGEAGAHPVGAGVGAAAGTAAGVAVGTAAAVAGGALAGSVAGPIGTAVGAAVGGIVGGVGGGYAGKAAAEAIDPTAEEAYWQEQFKSRGYPTKGDFESYRPAFRYGVDAYGRHTGRGFDEVEPELSRGWTSARGTSKMTWQEAQPAVRDAYRRLCERRDTCNS